MEAVEPCPHNALLALDLELVAASLGIRPTLSRLAHLKQAGQAG